VDGLAFFPPKRNAPMDIPAKAATPSDNLTRKLRREGSPLVVWTLMVWFGSADTLTPYFLTSVEIAKFGGSKSP